MAKTIAKATGGDSSREKAVHRLGSRYSVAEANTWRTFATAYITADGSGYVDVVRDGQLLHRYNFPKEIPQDWYRDRDGTVWKPDYNMTEDKIKSGPYDGIQFVYRKGVFYFEVKGDERN